MRRKKLLGSKINLKNAVRLKGINLDELMKEMAAELDKLHGNTEGGAGKIR